MNVTALQLGNTNLFPVDLILSGPQHVPAHMNELFKAFFMMMRNAVNGFNYMIILITIVVQLHKTLGVSYYSLSRYNADCNNN